MRLKRVTIWESDEQLYAALRKQCERKFLALEGREWVGTQSSDGISPR